MLRRGTQPPLARPRVIFVRQLLGQKLRLFPALAPVRIFCKSLIAREPALNRRNEAELSCLVINLSPSPAHSPVPRLFLRLPVLCLPDPQLSLRQFAKGRKPQQVGQDNS